MFKKIYISISILIVFIFINIVPVSAIDNDKGILILYDTYNVYGDSYNILNSVNIMAMKTGDNVSVLEMNYYKGGEYLNYNTIIVIHNGTEDLPGKIKIDLKKFNGKQIGIGIKVKGLNLNISDIINQNIKSENKILKYLNRNKELSYRKYLVLNDVNAFMDLNKLVDEIDYLNNNGIPFILDVRPVYINTDLPAMQRFAEALRYAQSKGGYVILDTPYIEGESAKTNQIVDAMKIGYKKLIDYKVYPIALSIPLDLMYRDDMRVFLESSNTIFLKSEYLGILNKNSFINPKIKNLISDISYSTKENLGDIDEANNFAICIKNDLSMNEFKDMVNYLVDEVNFSNPSEINSDINIDNRRIKLNQLGLYLNNVEVTQERFINREEFQKDFNLQNKNDSKKDDFDISGFSKIIMIFAGIACGIFIIIAMLSKRIDRRKYFK